MRDIKLEKGSSSDRVNYPNVHSFDKFFHRFLCLSIYRHNKMDDKYLPRIDPKKFVKALLSVWLGIL